MSRPTLVLFGPPRLERKHVPVPLDTRKALALVAYLAVTRGMHSRDSLAALLWQNYDQSHARGALRRTLSVLHSALGPDQLAIEREAVGLGSASTLVVDVEEFGKRLDACRQHGHPAAQTCARCISPLTRAAELYASDFMSGFTLRDSSGFDEWQFFQAEGLRRDLAGVLERLVRHHGAAGEYEPAIAYARRWLALDPLHEPAHRQLMQLYADSNQRAAALRQYQECVRALRDELGVPPLEETTRLYDAIKDQRELTSGDSPNQTPIAVASSRAILPAASLPLVGRSNELAALLAAYAATGPRGRFVVLEGEAGIGKTRLAQALIEAVEAKGARTLTARNYEGEANLAYGPFIEGIRAALGKPDRARRLAELPAHVLAEATRLFPELALMFPRLPPVPSLGSPGAQSRFFEGLRQVLVSVAAGDVPGVLFVDDLQWADSASLDLLIYIVQRLRDQPLYVLVTWRGDEIHANHALHQLITDTQRAGILVWLQLARLSQTAVGELVRAVPGAQADIGERLYRETEGLPFFLVEYLTSVGQTGEWSIPNSVRDLIQSRLTCAGQTALQLLGAAAVVGRSFDFEILREASGRSEEEVIAGLEELTARGLVKEVRNSQTDRGPAFDFTHDKLRDVVYEGISPARARLVHRRVAEALVARGRNRDHGAMAGQIAFHLREGGQGDRAAEYYRLAGEYARSLYANDQALAHFQAAVALGHTDRSALQEAIGDLLTLKGDYVAAARAYDEAALASDAPSGRLEHKLGNLYDRRGEFEVAAKHYQAALAAACSAGTEQDCARLYADWSLAEHRLGHDDRAHELALRSLELAQEANDLPALCQVHNVLGILANSRGELEEARHHLEASVSLAERLPDPSNRAAALNNLALTFSARGEFRQAIELVRTALHLTESLGDRHRLAALHNNLADLYHGAGQSGSAMEHLKQAVSIFAEIGGEGNWQPEIWKLVEW